MHYALCKIPEEFCMDEVVFPTKGNLIASKNSHKLSLLGFDLLDKKRVILVNELMKFLYVSEEKRKEINALFAEAYTALQKANIVMGISNVEAISKSTPIENSIEFGDRSVMGVNIPVIKHEGYKTKIHINYGILGTDDSLDDAFCRFAEIKHKLIELSEIETTVYKLAHGVRKTTKRANALKNIMIPKFENQIKKISDVLDEKEREEFTWLKIIKKE
jgi:V/A-type H+-transporting ATPase subunit D